MLRHLGHVTGSNPFNDGGHLEIRLDGAVSHELLTCSSEDLVLSCVEQIGVAFSSGPHRVEEYVAHNWGEGPNIGPLNISAAELATSINFALKYSVLAQNVYVMAYCFSTEESVHVLFVKIPYYFKVRFEL